ncbi:MAG: 6-phosphogluconolactonase [Pseudomonadales bacterium]|nr:6-phosphogluconolactonase [Pseudomonadales bacterium]MCP5320589.1 6-phosphogluconolactonase [Pseudomonadales bacterium]MCP5336666.1 6-phosphogluconolactonase [Pseudomonadales bacterium]
MRLHVFDSPDALAARVAQRLVASARRAIAARGEFAVALSGGSTPRALYQQLAHRNLDWSRIAVYWSDERFVPRDSALSNESMARAALLDRVAAPRVFPMVCAGSAAASAECYERCLPERLDLVLLGLGADGHTASLFPGDAALHERTRKVTVGRGPDPAPWRITLSVPYINRARAVWFLVAGADKTDALARVLHGPEDPERTPAQAVARHARRVTLYVDRAAAGDGGKLPAP